MGYKKRRTEQGFWPHRPGYNWLLGYSEGGRLYVTTEGIKEFFIDRRVKDGNH